jgi:1-acyl-sn-glycerol-3-phosphate acyltransferase
MKNFLSFISGMLSLFYIAINTIIWTIIALTPIILIKLLLPFKPINNILGKVATGIGNCWVFWNNFGMVISKKIDVVIEDDAQLDPNLWYLVICNHQSWVDIPLLQRVLYKKVPFIKFFLKKQLFWVPVLGTAWWALDFPFMKRYSLDQIRKNPNLKTKDKETTRKACEKFKQRPVSIMTFVEGTRFRPEKKQKISSPYNHLMRPKAAAIGLIMTNMQDTLNSIINVSICYPEGSQEIWPFLCGKLKKVVIKIEKIDINENLKGDYYNDPVYKKNLQRWINQTWAEKDAFIKKHTIQK